MCIHEPYYLSSQKQKASRPYYLILSFHQPNPRATTPNKVIRLEGKICLVTKVIRFLELVPQRFSVKLFSIGVWKFFEKHIFNP